MKADVLDENSDKPRYPDSSSAATSRSLSRVLGNVCCSLREADVRFIRNKQISGRRESSPRQINIMNNEIDLAKNLSAELREAYRGLPRYMQVRVASLLQESAPKQQSDAELVS